MNWRPIETAPKEENSPFLALVHYKEWCGGKPADVVVQVSWFEGWMYPDRLNCLIDWDDRVLTATHWMPLPDAP